ncbi:MAG: hypothetical protein KDA84_07440 [Planctomycetaceae bacterium]|nr:hypothetical protein [Planctomycetaceae bacterium]
MLKPLEKTFVGGCRDILKATGQPREELMSMCKRIQSVIGRERAEALKGVALIPDEIKRDAGHALFALAVCDEAREMGREDEFEWSGADIYQTVPRAMETEIVEIVDAIVADIGMNWGRNVDYVLRKAGDLRHALTDLLLGYVGHGVSIRDDYAELVEDLPDHGYGDDSPFMELAWKWLASGA